MDDRIQVGAYVETTHLEEAVCIGVEHVDGACWVSYRYEAVRPSGEILWVENTDVAENVQYVRPSDRGSERVVSLRGPYGLD